MKLRERWNYVMLVLMLLVLASLASGHVSGNRAHEGMDDISTAWEYKGDTCNLPIKADMKDDQKYVISRILPDTGIKGSVLVFKTENIFWSVSLDGKLIDSYSKGDNAYFNSKTAGDRWNFVTLPEGAGGKNLSITMIPTDAVTANYIDRVYISSLEETIRWMNRRFIPALIFSVAIMVFGLFYLALSEVVIYKWKEKRQLTFVGLFAVFACSWTVMQSPFAGYTFGDKYLMVAIGYMSLPWLIGFVLLAAYCGHQEKYSVAGRMVFSIPFAYGVLIVLLDMLGLVSFGNSLVVTLAFASIVILGTVIHSVRELISTKLDLAQSKTIIAIANIMIAISSFSDLIRCVFFHAEDYSKDFRTAALAYMIVIGMDALLTYAEEQNLIEGAGVMKQIAMHDGLTGVFNRMAFNDRVDILPKQSNVGFIHFDVNNLKYANDTYGHSEGDALIKMAAHGIEKSFGSMGECYRYGGDEFTIITENYNVEKIKECMGNLRIYMALVNHDGDMLRTRLSMACGYAHFSAGEDESLAQTFERADKRMYDNKRGMKELAARLGGSL